jgi:hypothetical protein
MDKLEALHQQLNSANVSDDMIARGVRLTKVGYDKLARKFGVSTDDVVQMLHDLRSKFKAEMVTEEETDGERFAYESDFMGNVTLRDTKTGASRFLQGEEAFRLLHEIERVHPDFQFVISPYFTDTLNEFVEDDVMSDDTGNSGGTYNFPFRGNFACARFWMAGAKPRIEVVSIVDANGEELNMDDSTKADAEKVAWEWVNKV